MSEKYVKLIKKSRKRKRQQRLIIKNGIQYVIAITIDKKPKFKKTKYIKAKKWLIKDVLLHSYKIVNKDIIKEIIEKDSTQQESYDKCFAMDTDALYTLMLSDKQYNTLLRFIAKNNIYVNMEFSFRRIGTGFKTKLVFSKEIPKKEK